jgi:excisionase family DNA binding protein
MSEIPGYLTVNEAAERRGVRRQAILALIARGRLKAFSVGKQWLIKKADLEAFEPLPAGRPRKRTKKSPKASKTQGSRKNERPGHHANIGLLRHKSGHDQIRPSLSAKPLQCQPYCIMHSSAELARELGRRGGKANIRVKPNPNPPEIPPLGGEFQIRPNSGLFSRVRSFCFRSGK